MFRFLAPLLPSAPAEAPRSHALHRFPRAWTAGLPAAMLFLWQPAAALAQSAFQGTWKGAWRDQGSGQDGLMVLKITRGGTVNGAVSNRQSGLTGPLKGSINSSGFLSGSYGYRESNIIRVYQTTCAFARSGNQMAGTARFLFQGRLIGVAAVALERDGASAPPPPRKPSIEAPARPSPVEPTRPSAGSDLKN